MYYSLAGEHRSVLAGVEENRGFGEVGRWRVLLACQSCSAPAVACSYELPNFYIMNYPNSSVLMRMINPAAAPKFMAMRVFRM